MALPPLFTSAMRDRWDAWRCNPAKMVRVSFPGVEGAKWRLLVADAAAPAWIAFAKVMVRHGYLFRESAGGTYNCRHTNHDPDLPWSLHSYGVAADLNPAKNPQGTQTTDMPAAFRADVKAIVCGNGRPAFRWGGDWKGSVADPMHWQLGCSPADLETGIIDPKEKQMDYVEVPPGGAPPREWADGPWERYSDATGTDVDTRAWPFFREDLSWFWEREIVPREKRIKALEGTVANLENRLKALEDRPPVTVTGGIAFGSAVKLVKP